MWGLRYRKCWGGIRRACTVLLAAAIVAGSMVMLPPGALVLPVSAQVRDARLENLTVVTASGRHVFKVEVMRKPEELARGLMFRRSLPSNRGMLFDFGDVRPVAMWMRNTYISLDMVFIDAKGVVTNVAINTEPLSEETIMSARPVLSVLEVIAGTAKRIGLKAGDRIEHPLFRPGR